MNSIKPNIVPQYRKEGCSDWYDGHPNHSDGGGPYETRTLFAAAPASERSDKSPAAPTMPEGWKLVPIVPTDDMRDAPEVSVGGCYSCSAQQVSWGECAEIYAAMIAAAPVAQPLAPSGAVSVDDVMRDMLAIQDACGLHTDEYAPGSVIEYIKELEDDATQPLAGQVAAPAAAQADVAAVGELTYALGGCHGDYIGPVLVFDLASEKLVPVNSLVDCAMPADSAAPSQQPTDSAAPSGEVAK